ncbi:MAG: putative bifunctional diguanylate cyclase/phosphodiesterase, partial [Rhodoferax sp.]
MTGIPVTFTGMPVTIPESPRSRSPESAVTIPESPVTFVRNTHPAVRALRRGDAARARVLAQQAASQYDLAVPALEELSRWQFEAALQVYEQGVARFTATRQLVLALLVLTASVMAWLSWLFHASIVGALERAQQVFAHIAQGRYDSEVPVHGSDEFAQLLHALGRMQTKLGEDEAAIHQLAFFDALTQLPNRRLLCERLQHALQLSERTRQYGAVLMLDLDQFKAINDTQGHAVGDLLLVQVAQRLQECVRQSDTVARLGGDEFIVLLVDLGSDEACASLAAERVAEKILAALQRPCLLDKRVHRPCGSLGVCLFLGRGVAMEELLKRADMSMYQAKSGGRNTLRFFDPQVQARLEVRASLEADLHDALAQAQLQPCYQMQVGAGQRVLGAELLLRWQHPRLGLVQPQDFIPIAEESGLIVPIGDWVLRTACAQLQAWAQHPQRSQWVLSVNVSPRQFRQDDFVDGVRQALLASGVSASRLKLELTESLVLHNLHDAVVKMKQLNRLGVHFSMDDFGTGYSSLAHLTALPIHQLKIDRSFVREVAHSEQDAVVVQTIIAMAHALGVRVIAEGVETDEQRQRLQALGCEAFQGFLFGAPAPVQDMEVQAQRLHPYPVPDHTQECLT